MNFFRTNPVVQNQLIFEDRRGVSLYLKREDQIHPVVSGNKFRKLKYNLKQAKEQKFKTLLTYGGAFSNHIAATAKAGQLTGFKTIGIIRGEELGRNLQETLEQNETLRFAHECGMQLDFISRKDYREKSGLAFRESMKNKWGDFYEIPEGGTNSLAIRGCREILTEGDSVFDVVACSVGTGGTLAGIIEGSHEGQKILGFPALKGDFLEEEVWQYTKKENWELINTYHFGGYGKITDELINFINEFSKDYGVQLDPVYTGKLIYGITDLIRAGYFSENTRILAVHTGGLQGIAGMNERLRKKGSPVIKN